MNVKGTQRGGSKRPLLLMMGLILLMFTLSLRLHSSIIVVRSSNTIGKNKLRGCNEETSSVQQPIQQQEMVKKSSTIPTIPRAHRIERSNLPHKCGMVFFYHVPSTGGATIKQWLRKYSSQMNVPLFEHWVRNKDGSGVRKSEKVFIEGNRNHGGMNEFVTNITQNEWRISHCHHSSMHLNVTEHYLSEWRSAVEDQGCAFIANVMFRDPLGHALSLFKHIDRYDSSRDVWTKHLYTKSEMGQWQTQLDYFLYNFLDRNPYGVDKDIKVQRALQLLHDHFDIVSVGDHNGYKKKLLSMTGWDDLEMERTNTYNGELTFTKEEIEEMQKLMNQNGDTDFMYEVSKLYK